MNQRRARGSRAVLLASAALLAACGGGGRPAVSAQSRCSGWLSVAEAARILGTPSVSIVTEDTAATHNLDAGGLICEYEGYSSPQPGGSPSSAIVLDVWAHVHNAVQVYDDYVAGLSGRVTPVAGLGDAAVSAPEVIVARVRDSVFVIGGNDVSVAQQIAGKI